MGTLGEEVARLRAKYIPEIIVTRIKRVILEPSFPPEYNSPDELLLELYVLDFIEQQSMAILAAHGITGDDTKYYVGYAKRLWALALKFGAQTYINERRALTTEYVTRGWVEDRLKDLWGVVDTAKTLKQAGAIQEFTVFVGEM